MWSRAMLHIRATRHPARADPLYDYGRALLIYVDLDKIGNFPACLLTPSEITLLFEI